VEVVWFTAMSIDGKLAAAGDSLAFLDSIRDQELEASDFTRFLDSVDAVVVAAGTLRWLVREGHGWPHADKPTWVVTHDAQLVEAVRTPGAELNRFEGDLSVLRATLLARGFRRVWCCGGGTLAGQLLALDAIDEVVVTIAPEVVGPGPGLFGEHLTARAAFDLVECRVFAANAVRVTWRRRRAQERA
jgi:riboflavin biosynthesis pyrimidine reductase